MSNVSFSTKVTAILDPNFFDPVPFVGKTVSAASFDASGLLLTFTDTTTMKIHDLGTVGTGSRWFNCDDDPQGLLGGVFEGLTVQEIDVIDTASVCSERAYIRVRSDVIDIVIVARNDHADANGGFAIAAQ